MNGFTRVGVTGMVAASCALGLAFVAASGCSFGSSTHASEPDAHFGTEGGAFDGAFSDGQGGGGDGGVTTDGGGTEGGAEASGGDGGCSAGGGPGTWTCVGSMATARTAAGIAVLPGGKALVAGGWNATSGVLTSAEVFDSVNETFTATNPMSFPHLWGAWGAGWPQLPSGKVLVAGGLDGTGALETQAEIYDPVAGSFATTGPLVTGVISMFPVVLADSSVLFVGGWNSTTGAAPTPGWQYTGSGTSEVQRFVPSSGMFADTGPLAENRLVGCNVVLSTGHVLAIGGANGPSSSESNIEDYDPAAGKWTTVGTLSNPSTCSFAFVVSSTKVLLLNNDAAQRADLLDTTAYTTGPTTGYPAGVTPAFVQLANGGVLAMGNGGSGAASSKAYLYSVANNTWSATGDMGEARVGFPPPVLLSTGAVLIAGGTDASGQVTATAELYHP